jgi:ferric-dicitrate binding protein FerR (iron transport regulator)
MAAAQMQNMPVHDPIPPGRDPRQLERAQRAWIRYKKMMRWMALAAFLAAVAAVLYLWATGETMRIHLVIATMAGVGLSVLLGTGLMGLVFLSNSGGHDDAVAGDRE